MALELMVTNIREIIGYVRIGGSLSCSKHALVEFAVLRNIGQVRSKVRPLNFRKADFQISREIVRGMPWETREVEQN